MAGPVVPRKFREPDFAYATLGFAEYLSDHLTAAAEKARPSWMTLRATWQKEIDSIHDRIRNNRALTLHEPVVREFIGEWIAHLNWPVYPMQDRIQIFPPAGTLAHVLAASNLTSVTIYIADLRDEVLAQLGNNDHDLHYGLMINAPPWVKIATRPEPICWESFKRQLRMVIHHEMGHFRWNGRKGDAGLRDEFLAHARGVAALRNGGWPATKEGVATLLEAEHPEAWSNDEIKGMILDTDGGHRLVRNWAWRRSRI